MFDWRKSLGIAVSVFVLLLLPAAVLTGTAAGATGSGKTSSEVEDILERAAGRVAAWNLAFRNGVRPVLQWTRGETPIGLTDNPVFSLDVPEAKGSPASEVALEYAAELVAAWTAHRSLDKNAAGPAVRATLETMPPSLISRSDLAMLLDAVSRNEADTRAVETALVAMATAMAAQVEMDRATGENRAQFEPSLIGELYSNQQSGRIGSFGISIYKLTPGRHDRHIQLKSKDSGSLLLGYWMAPERASEQGKAIFYPQSEAEVVIPATADSAYLVVLNPSATPSAYDLSSRIAEADALPLGQLSATPNPVQICGSAPGQTTIVWATQNLVTSEIRVGSANGKVFAQGVSGSAVAPWIVQPTLFYLIDISDGRNIELTRILVDVTSQGCPDQPSGQLAAGPNPVRVCQTGRDSTTLTWTTRSVVDAEIRVDSPTGTLVARGPNGSVQVNWITRPTIFYLMDITPGHNQLLAQLLVNTTVEGCQDPAVGSLSASPAVVQICGNVAGTTTLRWSTSNAATAEVRVGSATGQVVAAGLSGSVTVPWIQGATLFYLIDTTGGRNNELARILVDVSSQGCPGPPRGQIEASPNPVQVCFGTAGTATISWDTEGSSDAEIRIGGPDGKIFARGLSGTAGAAFLNQPTLFVLYDVGAGGRTELARVLVGVSNRFCPSAQ